MVYINAQEGSSLSQRQIGKSMKQQDNNTSEEADMTRLANPMLDIVTATERGCLRLSEVDMQILRELKQNPPQPTTTLVEMLQQQLSEQKPQVKRSIVP